MVEGVAQDSWISTWSTPFEVPNFYSPLPFAAKCICDVVPCEWYFSIAGRNGSAYLRTLSV